MGTQKKLESPRKGPLVWMASNSVAANLLMILLIVGGLLVRPSIRQEVFPEADTDYVSIAVAYPGAGPSEVEEGVTLAIEEAVSGLEEVKAVSSTSSESVASVFVELLSEYSQEEALNNIRNAVDRITSFPEDIERPDISIISTRSRAISLVIYGDLDERTLNVIAEDTRTSLLRDERITQVTIDGVRAPEISIEIPQATLREYGITLEQVSRRISQASLDLPSGGIRSESGEVLLRTTERREHGSEFEDLVIISGIDGTEVALRDIATIDDGFSDTETETYFNGQPAVRLNVQRVGNQTPIEVSEAVKEYLDGITGTLPPGVHMSVWADSSEIYKGRIELLLRNGYLGLILVLMVLGLFLEIRLAFWVMLGIPISYLGAMFLMPTFDASLNMISLFAFILTLGIVVDDAIVVGEAVYKHREEGKPPLQAAIDGAREVAGPVIFSILTTMVAFMPMLFIPGFMGEFIKVIPVIVLLVLVFSLVESLFILPAHLAHSKQAEFIGFLGIISRLQNAFSIKFEKFTRRAYQPFVHSLMRFRYLLLATSIALLSISFGLKQIYLDWSFMPKIESDVILTPYSLPFGSNFDNNLAIQEELVEAAQQVFDELGDEGEHSRGILSQVGTSGEIAFGPGGHSSQGGNEGQISVFLVPSEDRPFTAEQFSNLWREKVRNIPGLDSIRFWYTTGPGSREGISVQLSHDDLDILEAAALNLSEDIGNYSGVVDVDDGFSLGKEQLDFRLTDQARSLGIKEVELARQLRSSFYGTEAVRLQRGRDELRVYVRLPDEERESEFHLESLVIPTPLGGEIPLLQAAEITRGRAFTSIRRNNNQRIMNVTTNVDDSIANANEIVQSLEENELPVLMANVPGLSFEFRGQQQEQRETMDYLKRGGLLALLTMFGLMAIAFKSYLQPIIIMFTIPFGIFGAFAGHLIMGFDLSLMSIFGIVALTGIVINDSLILIDAINKFRDKGLSPFDAVVQGGCRRFRAIILTSLTTFLGLFPMLMETSVQAQFLIPMAISLGFGVLFATFITLFLVPALYLAIEDGKRLFISIANFLMGNDTVTAAHDEVV